MYITLPAAYQTEITILFIVTCLLTGLMVWLTYLLVKMAIREGIKESGLVDALRRQSLRDSSRPIDHIPDIRAD